jgi:hypothetical protein
MSGASAIASARRRRGPLPSDNNNLQVQEQRQQKTMPIITEEYNKNLSPLQLLQVHDSKITELESGLESKITNIVTKVLSNLLIENNDKIKKETVSYTENKIKESFSSLKVNINYDEIISKVNNSLNQEFSSKFNSIDNTLTSLSNNIEKTPHVSIDDNLITNIQNLNNEMNELKLLVIKNQTLSLESNVETNKLRESLNLLEDKIETIETSINGNQNNDTEMLLRTMFQGQFGNPSFSKINIHDDNEDDSETSNDNLNIDNLDESILCQDIEITDDIIQEIKTELTEEKEEPIEPEEKILELVEQ